jgi:hypothetical protein
MHIREENKLKKYIYNTEMRGGGFGQQGQQFLTATAKIYIELGLDEKFYIS